MRSSAAAAGVGVAVIAIAGVVLVALAVVGGDREESLAGASPRAVSAMAPAPAATTVAPRAAWPEPPSTPSPTPTPSPSPTPAPTSTPTPSPAATPAPRSVTLRYDTYDTTGAVTEAGSYAFLGGEDGASVVTTYEALRDGTVTSLRIHTSDADEASRSDVYDDVETGDLVEWKEADDCFVRYQVMSTPQPAAGALKREFGVEWMTYAFTGCSGAVSSDASVDVTWGTLPDLGGFSLTVPLVHGVFQIVPSGWQGAIRERQILFPDHMDVVQPTGATTLAEAREFPYWRDVTLPNDDWRLDLAWMDVYGGPAYGYCANFVDGDGYAALEVCGYYASSRYNPQVAAGMLERNRGPDVQSVKEARVIAGRPAIVLYSPDGQPRGVGLAYIWLYDSATTSEYALIADNFELKNDIDAVIAIARSLFEDD